MAEFDRNKLIAEAKAKRVQIEEAAAALSDEQAYDRAWMFPLWDSNSHTYSIGDRVQYEGQLYRCLTEHTSQGSWKPDVAPSLWVRIDDPAIEWPEWRQPTGSTDAYPKGAKVSHNGKHWISDVDANVWEPGVTGWTEQIIS